MILKTYQKYIIRSYLSRLLYVTCVFFCLIFILNIFEEINFFKDLEVSFFLPIFLTFLNTPSVIYYIFPFIFLISTQFFFIKLYDNDELNIFKKTGLNNTKILTIITFFSLLLGILIILLFYNFSSKLKFFYFDLKNKYSQDDKYLAVINENGLWIKDEINNEIIIINADKIDKNYLINVNIAQLDKKFKLIQIIYAEKVNIESNDWIIDKAKISKNNINTIDAKNLTIKTNFNMKKINSIFSNLSSLTIYELINLKADYKLLGYSTLELNLHIQKIYSFPIYLMIMTIFSSIIMMNIKYNRPKIFNIILGIFLSVLIYYANYLFNILGQNGKLPVSISVWMPLVIMIILSSIGLVKINEK